MLTDLTSQRETLKSVQLDFMIKSFYTQTNQLQEMPALNLEGTEMDVKTKTLSKSRKLCEAAAKMIKPVGVEEKQGPRVPAELRPTSSHHEPIHHMRQPPRQKQELVDDDVAYFVCSLMTELQARGMVGAD